MTTRLFRTSFMIILIAAICLSPAAPRAQTNVCARLIQKLLLPVPQESVECTWSAAACVLMPHCCSPLTCGADPTCGAIKIITQIDKWISKGEVYCHFSPAELFDRFAKGQVEITAEMLAGGLPREFYNAMDANISILKASSIGLSPQVKQALRDLVAPLYQHGDNGYSYSDVDSVTVVSASIGNASWYLRDAEGITLTNLVVLQNNLFQALVKPANKWTLDDIQWGRASPDYITALDILDHELVHVAQSRRYGSETFRTNYILDWLVKGGSDMGYQRSSYENEAYQFGAALAQAAGGPFCETTAADHIYSISTRHLNVDWQPCRPYKPWLFAILVPVLSLLH